MPSKLSEIIHSQRGLQWICGELQGYLSKNLFSFDLQPERFIPVLRGLINQVLIGGMSKLQYGSVLMRLVQKIVGFTEEPNIIFELLDFGLSEMMLDMYEKCMLWLTEALDPHLDKFYEELLETIGVLNDYNADVKDLMLQMFNNKLIETVVAKSLRFTTKIEAIKIINLMLERCSAATRDKLCQSALQLDLLNPLGKMIPIAGDYELQVGITEALFRLTHKGNRGIVSQTWFDTEVFHKAFMSIRDSMFETDCRLFLNVVNNDPQGGKCTVLSYPCQSVFLGQYQLKKPVDPNYPDFWVDFNTVSRRITLFVVQECTESQREEDLLWETIAICDRSVIYYSVDATRRNYVSVDIRLISSAQDLISFSQGPLGNTISIVFDNTHDVQSALSETYGLAKFAPNRKVKISDADYVVQIGQKKNPESVGRSPSDSQLSSAGNAQPEIISPSQAPQRKVSVPCEPMITPTANHRHSEMSNKSNPSSVDGVDGNKEVPSQTSGPATVRNDVEPRKNKPSKKVSVPIMDILVKPASQQAENIEEIVPSSVPEETLRIVPDSQPAINLPALCKGSASKKCVRKQDMAGFSNDDTALSATCTLDKQITDSKSPGFKAPRVRKKPETFMSPKQMSPDSTSHSVRQSSSTGKSKTKAKTKLEMLPVKKQTRKKSQAVETLNNNGSKECVTEEKALDLPLQKVLDGNTINQTRNVDGKLDVQEKMLSVAHKNNCKDTENQSATKKPRNKNNSKDMENQCATKKPRNNNNSGDTENQSATKKPRNKNNSGDTENQSATKKPRNRSTSRQPTDKSTPQVQEPLEQSTNINAVDDSNNKGDNLSCANFYKSQPQPKFFKSRVREKVSYTDANLKIPIVASSKETRDSVSWKSASENNVGNADKNTNKENSKQPMSRIGKKSPMRCNKMGRNKVNDPPKGNKHGVFVHQEDHDRCKAMARRRAAIERDADPIKETLSKIFDFESDDECSSAVPEKLYNEQVNCSLTGTNPVKKSPSSFMNHIESSYARLGNDTDHDKPDEKRSVKSNKRVSLEEMTDTTKECLVGDKESEDPKKYSRKRNSKKVCYKEDSDSDLASEDGEVTNMPEESLMKPTKRVTLDPYLFDNEDLTKDGEVTNMPEESLVKPTRRVTLDPYLFDNEDLTKDGEVTNMPEESVVKPTRRVTLDPYLFDNEDLTKDGEVTNMPDESLVKPTKRVTLDLVKPTKRVTLDPFLFDNEDLIKCTKKTHEKKKKVKKSVFSETEIDTSKSEVSWLNSENRRMKPKAEKKYSHRHREKVHFKPKSPDSCSEEENVNETIIDKFNFNNHPLKPQKPKKKRKQKMEAKENITIDGNDFSDLDDLYYEPSFKKKHTKGGTSDQEKKHNLPRCSVKLSPLKISSYSPLYFPDRTPIRTPVKERPFQELAPVSPMFHLSHFDQDLSIERARDEELLPGSQSFHLDYSLPIEESSKSPRLQLVSPAEGTTQQTPVEIDDTDTNGGSQDSNYTHISSIKSPKTPNKITTYDATKDVEQAEDDMILSLEMTGMKSGPSKFKRQDEEEESDDEDEENASQSSLRPRKLFHDLDRKHISSTGETQQSQHVQSSISDDDLGSQSGSRQTPFDEDTNTEYTGPSTLLLGLGKELQNKFGTMKEHYAEIANKSTEVIKKHVLNAWGKGYSARKSALCNIGAALTNEANSIENDIDQHKECEEKMMSAFHTQVKNMQKIRANQHMRLKKMDKCGKKLMTHMTEVDREECDKMLQGAVKGVISKEMNNMSELMLKDMERQEMRNIQLNFQLSLKCMNTLL